MTATPPEPPRLQVRQATVADISQLVELTARVYTAEWGHSAGMLRGQMAQFPEGQFVAVSGDRIVERRHAPESSRDDGQSRLLALVLFALSAGLAAWVSTLQS